ncbi:hypothetical protein QBC45DRAFT_24075 [Copromyces sp. CBS 386.78]|nr:hypothetical protein QBC45DRAFT_24075 [Copromyces sp. CBS 386.78]
MNSSSWDLPHPKSCQIGNEETGEKDVHLLARFNYRQVSHPRRSSSDPQPHPIPSRATNGRSLVFLVCVHAVLCGTRRSLPCVCCFTRNVSPLPLARCSNDRRTTVSSSFRTTVSLSDSEREMTLVYELMIRSLLPNFINIGGIFNTAKPETGIDAPEKKKKKTYGFVSTTTTTLKSLSDLDDMAHHKVYDGSIWHREPAKVANGHMRTLFQPMFALH